VKAIAEFAESVGSAVLVEGVESPDELRTAYRMGARYAQGFYFAKPSPEPLGLSEKLRKQLGEFMEEYTRRNYSVDLSINRMVSRPATMQARKETGGELDRFFKTHNSVSHVVAIDTDDRPEGLITRQSFYSRISGRYGYAIFENKPVESLLKRRMLIVNEQTDLRVMGKLAMARDEEDLYDPVVVVDKKQRLVGTITMKKVISRAFDTEVKFATNANPLTSLPGNVVVNVWLEELLHREQYSIAYLDLDRFKEYNDNYGFAAGDRMIKMLGELLGEFIQLRSAICRVGHIGGDDFILLFEDHVDEEFLAELAAAFDERKKELFNVTDTQQGYFISVNRDGWEEQVPLVTLSIAVVTEQNFLRPPHPGKLGESVAQLKKKIKEINAARGHSGLIFECRRNASECAGCGPKKASSAFAWHYRSNVGQLQLFATLSLTSAGP
jgi:diguanylate cyclase (GGDEF)-like protein